MNGIRNIRVVVVVVVVVYLCDVGGSYLLVEIILSRKSTSSAKQDIFNDRRVFYDFPASSGQAWLGPYQSFHLPYRFLDWFAVPFVTVRFERVSARTIHTRLRNRIVISLLVNYRFISLYVCNDELPRISSTLAQHVDDCRQSFDF